METLTSKVIDLSKAQRYRICVNQDGRSARALRARLFPDVSFWLSEGLQHLGHLVWSLHNQNVWKELKSQLQNRLRKPLSRSMSGVPRQRREPGDHGHWVLHLCPSTAELRFSGSGWCEPIVHHHVPVKSLSLQLPKSHRELTNLLGKMGNSLLLLNLQDLDQARPPVKPLPRPNESVCLCFHSVHQLRTWLWHFSHSLALIWWVVSRRDQGTNIEVDCIWFSRSPVPGPRDHKVASNKH